MNQFLKLSLVLKNIYLNLAVNSKIFATPEFQEVKVQKGFELLEDVYKHAYLLGI